MIKANAGRQFLLMLFLAVVLGTFSNLLRSGNFILPANSFDPRYRLTAGDRPRLISLQEAEDLFRSGKALFLDARPEEEYDWGHIPGARNLPSDALATDRQRILMDVSLDTPVVIYSDGVSCGRGAHLALILKQDGYRDVRVLLNGWSLWHESGLPTEIGAKPMQPTGSSGFTESP